jgi:two-component system, cell cycle response regulator
MESHVDPVLRELRDHVQRIARGDFSPIILSGSVEGAVADLSAALGDLVRLLAEAETFIAALSRGDLDAEPPPRNHLISPFKNLHANLRHLTWQTQQIAAGDLEQRVDFLGEFSVAFNSLIMSLQEKRIAEDKLRYMSNHDALTGLYNRGYFAEELARVERGRRYPVSIMMADLDGLKFVNDTLGHAAGDQLIQRAAQVIRHSVRGDDLVARMGGDEFAVLLPETDASTAGEVLLRIRTGELSLVQEGGAYQSGISVGIATASQGDSLVETLRRADQEMYENKTLRKQGRTSR